jgi:FlaA1/EpsC-like NDP-sugar epimerase
MTIPEACQLILQAAVLGRGGEVFVLDMGEPIRIRYLAEQMIRLAGKSPEQIAIVYTGLRPGEKLFEELFHPLESCQVTGHPKIRLAERGGTSWAEITTRLRDAEAAVRDFDEERLAQIVGQLLPEFPLQRSAAPADVIPIAPQGTTRGVS